MTLLQALILGIVQGITEFLPISSSGHLVIFEKLLNLPVENLKSFDVAVHVGTLIAIFIYFREDFRQLFRAIFKFLSLKSQNDNSNFDADKKDSRDLIKYLIAGTIPAVIAGLTLEVYIDGFFRNADRVALSMIAVGVIFFTAERVYKTFSVKTDVNSWKKALIIGLMQMIALIPGVSRSGMTISAGIFQGINREKAARFSFLLGSIAIFGAGLLEGAQVLKTGLSISIGALLTGFFAAAISGYLSVTFLMKFLKNNSLNVFAIYLIVFGLVMWWI